MFMTPMPPTISDSAATPMSRSVSVELTDDVVSMTDCWVVIEKSADDDAVIACR
jgi:hypothetical protein